MSLQIPHNKEHLLLQDLASGPIVGVVKYKTRVHVYV